MAKSGSLSKQKGSAFEREVCRMLSKWISRGKESDLFWRSAMSGGRASHYRKRGLDLKNQVGDIVSTSGLGMQFVDLFVVECKFYKDIGAQCIIWGQPGDVGRFWEQVRREAQAASKFPLLIVKQNMKSVVIGVTSSVADLCSGLGCQCYLTVPSTDMHVFLFADLLKLDADTFLEQVAKI